MKKLVYTPVIAAVFSLFAAQSALAGNGTVTFTGNITSQSCTINGGTQDISVVLPNVSASAFASAGDIAGRTPFNIALTGCSAQTGGVHTYFESGPSVDASSGRLNTTGTAAGVQIVLQNEDYSDIQVGFAEGSQNSKTFQLNNGEATLAYMAAYYATTDTVTPGDVNSAVTFSIIYE